MRHATTRFPDGDINVKKKMHLKQFKELQKDQIKPMHYVLSAFWGSQRVVMQQNYIKFSSNQNTFLTHRTIQPSKSEVQRAT